VIWKDTGAGGAAGGSAVGAGVGVGRGGLDLAALAMPDVAPKVAMTVAVANTELVKSRNERAEIFIVYNLCDE